MRQRSSLLRAFLVACLALVALVTIDLRYTPIWTPVHAAVGYDAVANARCTNAVANCGAGGTTLTYALTVGAGSLRQLAVFTFVTCHVAGDAPAVSSVTYAGTTLTQQESLVPNAFRRGYLHSWPTGSQPTSGANDVVVTIDSNIYVTCVTGANSSIHGGAISVTGVDQTTIWTDTNQNSGTSTSATLTLTGSGASDLGVHAVCAGSNLGATTETTRWTSDDENMSCNADGGATAAAADTSFSRTINSSDSWIMVGGAFKADAGGGGGTPGCRMLLLLGVGGTCS